MEFSIISVSLILLAAILALLGAKVLVVKGWFAGFIRGFTGFSLLFVAVVIVLFSMNLATYQRVAAQQVYAQVHFKQLADQRYKVSLTNVASGDISEIELQGDTWQLEVDRVRLWGKNSAYYQAKSLRSRYYALEQESAAAQQDRILKADVVGIDIAYWLHSYKRNASWAASAWKSLYYPMADGASYSVVVSDEGLQVKAINATAKSALDKWL